MTATNAMPGCGASLPPSPVRSPVQRRCDEMSEAPWRSSGLCHRLFVLVGVLAGLFSSARAFAVEPSDIESNLTITVDGAEKPVTLLEAMVALNIPAASIALID